MMRDDFCVFILSHGRADNIKTVKTLKRAGYTGKTYIIIDNEDKTADEYYSRFGDSVIMFDKLEQAKKFDTADLITRDRRAIVYARNACFDIAEKLGIRYFLELDDDYTSIGHKYVENGRLREYACKNADALFEAFIEFLNESGAITVAMAQGGDFIGGAASPRVKEKILRKAMNTFFCDTHKRFSFVGRINEDVCTYTLLGQKGEKLFTVTDASITQVTTQKNKNGMSNIYLESGTFLKSFYSVIFSPSCVSIEAMGDKHKRIHHSVSWEHCTPKILNQKHKKM